MTRTGANTLIATSLVTGAFAATMPNTLEAAANPVQMSPERLEHVIDCQDQVARGLNRAFIRVAGFRTLLAAAQPQPEVLYGVRPDCQDVPVNYHVSERLRDRGRTIARVGRVGLVGPNFNSNDPSQYPTVFHTSRKLRIGHTYKWTATTTARAAELPAGMPASRHSTTAPLTINRG